MVTYQILVKNSYPSIHPYSPSIGIKQHLQKSNQSTKPRKDVEEEVRRAGKEPLECKKSLLESRSQSIIPKRPTVAPAMSILIVGGRENWGNCLDAVDDDLRASLFVNVDDGLARRGTVSWVIDGADVCAWKTAALGAVLSVGEHGCRSA